MQSKVLKAVLAANKPYGHRRVDELSHFSRLAPLVVAGILLGRASLFYELSPFAVALFAAVRMVVPGAEWVTALALSVGVFWRGGPMMMVSFFGMVLAYLALEKILVPSSWERIVRAVLAGISVVVVRIPLLWWQAPTLYDVVTTLLEVALTMAMSIILVNSVSLLGSFTTERRFKSEEILSIAIAGALAIVGLSGISLFGVALQGIALKYLVMLSGLLGGAAWGAATGVAAPFLIYIGNPLALNYVGTYAFTGLVAGALKDWKKPGVIMGFMAATALSAVNFGGRDYLGDKLVEGIVASLLLMATSSQVRSRLYRLLPMALREEEAPVASGYASRLQVLAGKRLGELGDVFMELAETFRQPAQSGDAFDQSAHKLMDRLAQDVCEDCPGHKNCWGKDFYKTYQGLLDMLALTDMHGPLTIDMIPEAVRRRCDRQKELLKSLNSLCEVHRQTLYWQKRAVESRQLVASQLKGVAEVIDSLVADFNLEVEYLCESEEKIKRELAEQGLFSPQVEVTKGKNGRIEARITKHACSKEQNHCATVLIPLVTELLGRQVVRENRRCASLAGKSKCTVCLSTAQVLATDAGIAQLPRSQGISGDSFRIAELVGGKLALMISDGMGDGPLARQESRTAISLMEQMLRAGFDKEVTVQTINAVLALRSQGESFATVDMALLDLYTGNAEVMKIGASSSYHRRGDKVDVIRATTLPAGILSNIEIETSKLQLLPGDILVMLSDGVLEGQGGMVDKEEWLSRILRQATAEKAKDLAEYILNRARNNCGGTVTDDMTVLVLKILDKAISIPLVG
ncbi:MAG: stage II sporulation protein E [Firmicutes bacterium]|nr:stage II sporulation protein E [Dethiobacter sp.]MBS3887753.1 stage II sporulation protein E [Bacillota bacterium]MBS4053528.1 stage II sporulation protein E [Thermaerobacter sp.]